MNEKSSESLKLSNSNGDIVVFGSGLQGFSSTKQNAISPEEIRIYFSPIKARTIDFEASMIVGC